MKIPIDVKQFAARLTDEDLTLVNELLPDLLPDRDLTDNTITGREIFMAMTEAASLKLLKKNASNPADLQKIEALDIKLRECIDESVKYRNDLSVANAKANAQDREIERLQSLVDSLTAELDGISTENSQVKETAEKLKKYVPVPNEMRIVLEPMTSRLLALYAEKIRMRNKLETTPGEILTSLFVRYIIKRETELPGFPFLIGKPEIQTIARELADE